MSTSVERPAVGAPPQGAVSGLAKLWAWTLSVALLGSWTCFAAVPGINWTLWTLAAALGFRILQRRSANVHADRYSRTSLALACLLSGGAAITADPRADALVFLTVGALCCFAALALIQPRERIGPAALLCLPLALGRGIAGETGSRIGETLAAMRLRSAVPIMRGGLMAAGVAGTLFLLLSAADPILADWRDVAWSSMRTVRFLTHGLFFIALALVLLGAYGLVSRPVPADLESAESRVESLTPGARLKPRSSLSVLLAAADLPAAGRRIQLSDVERLMVLGAAAALFALFFAVELSTQFGLSGFQVTNILPRGETIAEATHRGFGQMIAAAVLCASVIIVLDRHSLRGRRERFILLLSWTVIAASLVLVVSAYLRVRFYELAYGFTEERIYAQVCCGAVLLSLTLLAWQLRNDAQGGPGLDLPGLTQRVALVGVACVGCLAYWNTAGWIVDSNMDRYERTGKIDVEYLARLARTSPDAIPALTRALARLPPRDALPLRDALQAGNVSGSILVPGAASRQLDWYEWSLRRAEASSAAVRLSGMPPATP
jgi:Domain of unknown function (DUF4153)